jgi:hypothetical protein
MLTKVEDTLVAGGVTAPATSFGSKYHTIAVLGSHPATVAKAPFDDPGVLVYACSPDNSPHGLGQHAKSLPRVDVWHEIHVPVFDKTLPYGYLNWLQNIPKVYMRDQVAMSFHTKDGRPLFPTAVPYPDEQMRGKKIVHPDGRVEFTPGEFHRSQFKSSIAFMMAKAIIDCEEHGIPSIGLWGILQSGGKDEYQIQRPSTQYFIEEAMRRGISVSVSPESRLLHDDPELF